MSDESFDLSFLELIEHEKFNLPLELQLDYLRRSMKIKRRSNVHTMDVIIHGVPPKYKQLPIEENLLELSDESSTSDDYDQETWHEDTTNIFAGVRDVALNLWFYHTLLQIGIYDDNMNCGDVSHGDDPLPNNMFSWTREHFLKRRQIKTSIWVTVLEKALPPSCMQTKKIKIDIESLIDFLEILFGALKTKDRKVRKNVQEFIRDTHAHINVMETLTQDLERNRKIIAKGADTLMAMKFFRRGTREIENKQALEKELEFASVVLPIEQRLQKQHYENITNQHQIKSDMVLDRLQDLCEEYQLKIEREEFRLNCVNRILYDDIEYYKLRIASMSERYDTDYEAINNEIAFKTNSIDKMKDLQKFYIEQIERFKEDLEQSRLRMLRNAELERMRIKKLAEFKRKLKRSKSRKFSI